LPGGWFLFYCAWLVFCLTNATPLTPWNNDSRFHCDPRFEIIGSGDVAIRFGALGEITLKGLALPAAHKNPSAVIDTEAMVAYQYRANGTRYAIEIPFWPRMPSKEQTFTENMHFDIELIAGNVAALHVWPRWWRI